MTVFHTAVEPETARPAQWRGFPFSPSVIPGLTQLSDAIAVLAGALTATLTGPAIAADDAHAYGAAVVSVLAAFTILIAHANAASVDALMRPLSRLDDVLVALITAFLFFLSMAFAFEASDRLSWIWMLSFALFAFAYAAAARLTLRQLFRHLSRRNLVGRSMVVLGTGEQGRRFLHKAARARPFFTRVVGVFSQDDPPPDAQIEGVPVLGGVDTLIRLARTKKIDDIIVAMPWAADRTLTESIEQLKELPVNIYLSTDLVGFELAFRPAVGDLSELPMFEVVRRPISGWSSALKIIEDYTITLALIICLSPLLIAIAILIKIDSPGPVLFRQKRLGFNNQVFDIYKFRSMYHRPDETHVRQATKGDPRVTRVGRIIRATSLDELPQLFNVLDGTMSLVGPRPHAVSHNEEYGRKIRGYFARHKVKPGSTGSAQVNGFRGETEDISKMQARVAHDLYYAENWSFFFDFRILITTVIVVFFQKSAY